MIRDFKIQECTKIQIYTNQLVIEIQASEQSILRYPVHEIMKQDWRSHNLKVYAQSKQDLYNNISLSDQIFSRIRWLFMVHHNKVTGLELATPFLFLQGFYNLLGINGYASLLDYRSSPLKTPSFIKLLFPDDPVIAARPVNVRFAESTVKEAQ